MFPVKLTHCCKQVTKKIKIEYNVITSKLKVVQKALCI